MPHTDSSMYRPVLSSLSSPPNDRPAELSSKKPQRHSMGVTFNESATYEEMPVTSSLSRPGSLQTSYSTNDVPTIKNLLGYDSAITPPKTHAEQQFHNHNVSLGRIPVNGVSNRQSRDLPNTLSGLINNNEDNIAPAQSVQSNLHAGAAPFGPQMSSAAESGIMAMTSPTMAFNNSQTYAYSMQSYNVNQMTSQMALNSSLQAYQNQSQGAYGQFGGYGQFGKGQEGQHRGNTGRRMHNGDETRYNNVPLESYRGNLYELCKDQHGCRYLQRKLEDGNAEHIEAIYTETCPHIIELMTGKIGSTALPPEYTD
jgi:Pumilio-family RNA binding repeat